MAFGDEGEPLGDPVAQRAAQAAGRLRALDAAGGLFARGGSSRPEATSKKSATRSTAGVLQFGTEISDQARLWNACGRGSGGGVPSSVVMAVVWWRWSGGRWSAGVAWRGGWWRPAAGRASGLPPGGACRRPGRLRRRPGDLSAEAPGSNRHRIEAAVDDQFGAGDERAGAVGGEQQGGAISSEGCRSARPGCGGGCRRRATRRAPCGFARRGRSRGPGC